MLDHREEGSRVPVGIIHLWLGIRDVRLCWPVCLLIRHVGHVEFIDFWLGMCGYVGLVCLLISYLRVPGFQLG